MNKQQRIVPKGRVAKPAAEKPKAQIQKENIPIKNNKEGLNKPVPVVNVASATVAAPIAKEQNDVKEASQNTSISAKEMLDAQYPTPTNNNFDVNDYPIAGPGKPTAEEVVVPKTPAEDPSFKALTSSINANAKKQRKHEPAQSASKKAQKAAVVPSNERLSKAQASQVEVMEQQETGEFKASDFKEQLKSRIAEMELPKDEEAADKFKENNNLSEVKSAAMGDVKTAQDNASGGIPEATSAAPSTASVPVTAVAPMPKAMPGKKPAMIPTAQAMPSKRSEASVEKPLQEETASLDTQMEQHGVTDTMLANSNEASFKSALDEKNNAKAQSKASVVSFRNTENQELNTAQQQSQQQVNATSQGMHTNRVAAFNKVAGNQKQSATQNTAARKQVADKIQGLYTETKTKVTSILSALDAAVASKFESGARAAQQAFENHIETNMKAYKEKRYGSSIFSWKQLRRVKDAFVGLPKEVNQFFESGRKIYIDTMDSYLGSIATLVANELNKAKRTIKEGKKSVQDYVGGLSPDLRKIGKQAANEIQSKFDSLEQDIDNKKDTLIDVLSQKYSEAVASVDTQIEALKEKNSGLINKAMGALKGVFDIIIKVKNTLTNLLANVVTAVGAIISDPIGFFKMLITGVGQGVQNFMTNIVQYLQSGLLGWLTGAMGSLSIQMPENIFSLKGIFSLTTQILGFTWSTIRTVGVKVVGEPIVKALETGFEMVQILREKGIAGLWEHLKEQFQDLKETVIGAIKDMLMSQVIQAGIKWILGLLSPVGAFVKAIMAIIDVVKFFIQRASQIAELVSAFTESIAAIAAGKVGAVAKSIENALGKAVPVVIGLLASVLGIGGLANKVLGIVRKIRKRVEKALFSLWTKIKNAGRKVWRKLSRKKGSSKKIKEDNKKQKPEKITAKDRAKHKKMASKIKAKLSAKSNKKTKDFKEFYEIKTKEAKKLEDKYQPKLKKGINLDITSGTLSQERKDNDIDFNIKIYPNTTEEKLTLEYDKNIERIYKENKESLHSEAEKDVRLAFEQIKKEEKKKESKNRKRSWSGLLDEFKTTDPTKELYNNPVKNQRNYGDYVRGLFKKSADRVMGDASDTEKNNEIESKINTLTDGKRVYQTIRGQIFDKSKEVKVNEQLDSLFRGEEGEHEQYKVLKQEVDFTGTTEGVLVVNYKYLVKKGDQPEETKTFKVTLQQAKLSNGLQGIKHKVEGFNLAIKEPGTRGKTASAVNKASREQVQKAKAENSEVISQITKLDEGNNESTARVEKKDQFKDQIDDKTIKFNASHLIADWFQGSGYVLGLNLVNTSEHYNKQVMFEKEKQIESSLTDKEDIYKAKYKRKEIPVEYITFNMKVEAEWIPIVDNEIFDVLREKTKKQSNETQIETKERLESLHQVLSKRTDPKFCNSVVYEVPWITLNGANGEKIVSVQSGLPAIKIGQDINLKDSLKNQS
ncbi:DNA/RNA non-specific endonuclease [Tenacibaculum sp. M341]|uniref:DNA/RNA non-specific endonuclease n=1 Tax=Tenacibaculum sp. M341 TaxID=2530339 RepID=UPI00104D9B90|nr:DNA/RNA non-specific endonuclease [Tenacibaculum sp. M341]TCI94796.1 hypothetical protein EYW44_00305 [Tenacibaculum sp. M341]